MAVQLVKHCNPGSTGMRIFSFLADFSFFFVIIIHVKQNSRICADLVVLEGGVGGFTECDSYPWSVATWNSTIPIRSTA